MIQVVGFVVGFALVWALLKIEPTDKKKAQQGNTSAKKRVAAKYTSAFGKL